MVIGVDFDNTMVCYDQLFHQLAVEQALIPSTVAATKTDVRDYLRRCGREAAWTQLQGEIYGAHLQSAPPFAGVAAFFRRCARQGIAVCVISHKTKSPVQGPAHDLHAAAHRWLEQHGFYDPQGIGLQPQQVYFELTKREKLARIVAQRCTHFVDDLPEFLLEPDFPAGVEGILFDPANAYRVSQATPRVASWAAIEARFFEGKALVA